MTEDELRDLLRHLACHLATIINDLETGPLAAVKQSQTGVRNTTTGSRPPCDTTTLDYLITDVGPRLRGWATYLQQDAGVTGLPVNRPLPVWAAWLSRHRETLLAQAWATDATAELAELESELRHRLHPTDPHQKAVELSGIVTIDTLKAQGIKDGTIRSWKSRAKNNQGPLRFMGTQTLSTGESIDLYKIQQPETA